MLPSTARNITCDTVIKGHYACWRGYRRKGASHSCRDRPPPVHARGRLWVPAFAGTTKICRPFQARIPKRDGQWASDLADREQQGDKAELPGAWTPATARPMASRRASMAAVPTGYGSPRQE